MTIWQRFFSWLQAGAPTGRPEPIPEIDGNGATRVPGLYVVGDLTGIPLLTHAIKSGTEVIRHFLRDREFNESQQASGRDRSVVDVAIVGAGPAGVAAAIECRKAGLSYRLLEASNHPFATIEGFPLGKPIRIKSKNGAAKSLPLRLDDGTRETLLRSLRDQFKAQQVEVTTGARVESVVARGDLLRVKHSAGELRARRVVIAVGKSGRPRHLGVPGEELSHTHHRLHDPAEFRGRRVVVNGGGDSAIEAVLALSSAGAKVTHVYRGEQLTRPKLDHQQALAAAVGSGAVEQRLRTTVERITADGVVLRGREKTETVACESVFLLLGSDPPTAFLRRCGIAMAGESKRHQKVHLTAMLSFFTMLYFGKKGAAFDLWQGAEGLGAHLVHYVQGPWAIVASPGTSSPASTGLFAGVAAGLRTPFLLARSLGLEHYQLWLAPLAFLIAWAASLVFVVSGGTSLLLALTDFRRHFLRPWPALKHTYLILAGLLFFGVYLNSALGNSAGWVAPPTQAYSFLYCTTMLLFGLRRIWVRRTRYVALQTTTLLAVQILFLYLLPFQQFGGEYLFDRLLTHPLAGHPTLLAEVFPQGRWTSFWFILFWPLSITSFGVTRFWTLFPLLQLALLFWLVRRYGKGAYCGWICSCGGMAETLGDEYRALAPHGPRAKRWENAGQAVLLFAVIATLLHWMAANEMGFTVASLLPATVWGLYLLLVDVMLAGVLGLGLYFLLGGRTWCRFFCPLAAIMHVMNRFSRYRIFARKEHCISCNACTRTCHMGIDVMGFANRGIPMNDVECVRCSSCVTACPMDVLTFGQLPGPDVENRAGITHGNWKASDWRAGLK